MRVGKSALTLQKSSPVKGGGGRGGGKGWGFPYKDLCREVLSERGSNFRYIKVWVNLLFMYY